MKEKLYMTGAGENIIMETVDDNNSLHLGSELSYTADISADIKFCARQQREQTK
jgi:hypothetical protein